MNGTRRYWVRQIGLGHPRLKKDECGHRKSFPHDVSFSVVDLGS
jgi:hypothetical protein